MSTSPSFQNTLRKPTSDETVADDILRAIRRILRRTAEHSRQLSRMGDLTVPQLLCLRKVAEATRGAPVTVADVSAAVQLSNATVSRILDRLEQGGLLTRERGTSDRRKVFLWLTANGKRRIKKLPKPLQEQFISRLSSLKKRDQLELLTALQRIVEMMDAQEIDAAPLLTAETELKPAKR